MIHMNHELFQQTLQEDKPVLVEFWAPWCVYCRRIEPAIAKLSEQFAGDILIGQVNIDDEPLLSHQEQIEVIPTFVLYRGGNAVSSIVAPDSKAVLESFIREGL